jgi:outer membrane protein assembly factor BamB
MAAFAAGALPQLPGVAAASGPSRSPAVLRRWASSNSALAPLTKHEGEVLFAGNHSLGRINLEDTQPRWSVAHALSGAAVFRPRAAGRRVLASSLSQLGAWDWEDGEQRWRYAAKTQMGVPWVAGERTFVGDGHELLALNNASGSVLWRFAGTPDTLTSYAPTLSGDTLFFGPGNGLLYALSATDGRLKWQLDRSGEWQYLRQLYASGDVLVAGSYKELLYGISVADGKVLWAFNAGNFINSHHVAGGSAYLWSPTGWVYAIDIQNGSVRWRHQTTNYGNASSNWGPLMAELVTHGEQLFALDMFNVLHVLARKTGEEMARIVFPQGLRPTLLPRDGAQAVVATEQGEIQWVQW